MPTAESISSRLSISHSGGMPLLLELSYRERITIMNTYVTKSSIKSLVSGGACNAIDGIAHSETKMAIMYRVAFEEGNNGK